ncbi:FAD-dependent oxidoreductase [Vulcanococcus limneticus]|uniref:FAD-dependent oxidoreductase n=1 Tax=Vulcanococcus limneticus TaxID=2170428 RepID=UPI00398BDB75
MSWGGVVVVGAGPAGCTLALQLARAGVPVTLVEARAGFARQFRGDALMPSGLEALARMGLWDLFERLPRRPLHGWSLRVEGRELFRVAEPLGSLQPCTLMRQQDLLEAVIAEGRQLPALQWRSGVAVTGLLREGERVVGVRLADGEALPAALVVAADGRDSPLRQQAGLTLLRPAAPIDVLWFRLPGHPQLERRNDFLTLVGGGAIASAFGGADGQLQIGWVLAPGEPQPQLAAAAWCERFAALAPPWLAEHLRGSAVALQGPLRLRVQVGLAPRWWQPGLLLLGDAAHPMSPVRAQGINMALRDSLVAAEALIPLWRAPGGAGSAGPAPAWEPLDRTLAVIQARREPEIRRMQALQAAEARQGRLIGHRALLRRLLAAAAPLLGPLARASWLRRQKPLREGLAGSLPAFPCAVPARARTDRQV